MVRKDDAAHNLSKDNPATQQNGHSDLYPKHREVDPDPDFATIVLVGLIGATITTAAVTRFRRNVYWFKSQPNRSYSSWFGYSGRSSRTSYEEPAGSRYQRRLREEMEEEMERVERIRRMQGVFNRERDKYKRSHGNWSESGTGEYHQHYQRNDWYWKRETSSRDTGTRFREAPRASGNSPLPHHYSILGLDRWRTKPYTDDEIKTAFRTKAKEFHPDQNQENKEAAEAKFKEIMASYEALKSERRNNQSS